MVAMGWVRQGAGAAIEGVRGECVQGGHEGGGAPSNTAPRPRPREAEVAFTHDPMQGQPAPTEVLDAEDLFFAGIERLDKFVEWGIELAAGLPWEGMGF